MKNLNLQTGEIYIGRLNNQHIILLPGDNDGASWSAQIEWAKSIGGDLPNRVEQAMLFAGFRDQFKEAAYWSNQQDTDPGYEGWAWFQLFTSGRQNSSAKVDELRARAVRRINIPEEV